MSLSVTPSSALATSSSSSDPRRPDNVTPFVFRAPSAEDLPFDMYSFSCLWFSLCAAMFNVRLYTWLNCLCAAASFANLRVSDFDLRTHGSQVILVALTFAATHGGIRPEAFLRKATGA